MGTYSEFGEYADKLEQRLQGDELLVAIALGCSPCDYPLLERLVDEAESQEAKERIKSRFRYCKVREEA